MNYTVALYQDSPTYFVLFDSHPRDAAGMRGGCDDGKALVKFFSSLDSICCHLRNYALSLGYTQDDACYNVMAFDVTRRCASNRDRSASIVYVSRRLIFNMFYLFQLSLCLIIQRINVGSIPITKGQTKEFE